MAHEGPLHPAGGGLLAAALESWGLGDLGLVLDPAAWSLENRAAATVLLVGAGLGAHRLLDSRRRKLRPHLAHALAVGQASRLPGIAFPADSRRPTREEILDRIYAPGVVSVKMRTFGFRVGGKG